MEQFLYQLRPTRLDMLSVGPTESEAATVASHFAYLQTAKQAGKVLMAGRTTENNEHTLGLVVFVAENETQAQDFMENDPAVKEGVMSATLQPYRVALWSDRGLGGE